MTVVGGLIRLLQRDGAMEVEVEREVVVGERALPPVRAYNARPNPVMMVSYGNIEFCVTYPDV